MRIDPKETINAITTRYPDTIAIFAYYGIDSCCGGEKTLEEAARRHGADIEELRNRLELATTYAEARLFKTP